MATVQLQHVSKRFGDVKALDDSSLTVLSGEFVALLGPSGCGKTTLLRMIAGFDQPDAGTICIGGVQVADGERSVGPERRNVGMVFQDYALFPHLSVARNVGFGLGRLSHQERESQVADVLELVGLPELGDRFPHELSGGQQQRVALARALAPEPAIVCLDEPWSAIDPLMRSQLRDEFAQILRRAGTTVLLVTHDREEALALADRVALMRDGSVIQVESPERLYQTPVDRWSAEFIGLANFIGGRASGGQVATDFGALPVRDRTATGACNVLIRPEMVGLAPDDAGDAVVTTREFRGHDVLYRVRLGDGSEVWSQRPSNELVAEGAKVSVNLLGGPFAVVN